MHHGEFSPCLAPTIIAGNSAKTIGGLQTIMAGQAMSAIVMLLKHQTGTVICLTLDLHAMRTSLMKAEGTISSACKSREFFPCFTFTRNR